LFFFLSYSVVSCCFFLVLLVLVVLFLVLSILFFSSLILAFLSFSDVVSYRKVLFVPYKYTTVVCLMAFFTS
jgi:hypothetical protein